MYLSSLTVLSLFKGAFSSFHKSHPINTIYFSSTVHQLDTLCAIKRRYHIDDREYGSDPAGKTKISIEDVKFKAKLYNPSTTIRTMLWHRKLVLCALV